MADILEIQLKADKAIRDSAKLAKRLDKVEKEGKQVDKQMKKTSKSMSGLAGKLGPLIGGAVGFGALVGVFKRVISATIEQENAINQLESRLLSTGGAVGYTSDQLQDFASDLQRSTTVGDEAILGMQRVLLTFTKVSGEAFRGATEAILNISQVMGTDLRSSAIQVGKALNDPIRGLDGLSRSGIQFSDAQKAVIKNLAETGRAAEAQQMILKELENQFGGAAEAAKDTFGGALKSVGNALGDLFEGSSSSTGESITALNDLEEALAGESMKAAFEDLTTWVFDLTADFVEIVNAIIDFSNKLEALANSAPGWMKTLGRVAQSPLDTAWEMIQGGYEDGLQGVHDAVTGKRQELEEENKLWEAEAWRTVREQDNILRRVGIKKPTSQEQPNGGRGGGGGRGGSSTARDEEAKELERISNGYIKLRESLEPLYALENKHLEKITTLDQAWDAGLVAAETYKDMITQLTDEYNKQKSLLENPWIEEALSAFESFADGFATYIVDSISDGKASFEDFVESFVKGMAKMMLQKSLMAMIPGGNVLGSLFGNAKGNAFYNGNVIPFAKGGVVNSPTVFPMGRGTGLMGEAGAEAIVPLSRGRGGHLGVGAAPVNISVTNSANADVSVEESTNENGDREIQFLIENAVKDGMANGRFNKTMTGLWGMKRLAF